MPKALKKIQILTRNQLKYIAMIVMCLCHATSLPAISDIYIISEIINPLLHFSVPIFMIFMVEGLTRTKHLNQHLLLMVCFGIITEPLFDLYFYGTPITFAHENILWTYLAYGLFYLLCIKSRTWTNGRNAIRYGIIIITAAVILIVAELTNVDYSAWGLLGMMIAYPIYMKTKNMPAAAGAVIIILIIRTFFTGRSVQYIILSCIALLISECLIFLYNPDKRCSHTKIQKYGGYAFYPGHLAVLCGIKVLTGGF